MSIHVNIVRIKAVSNALQAFHDRFAFVGGATVSLYADRLNFEVRPTDDVDVVIEVLSYAAQADFDQQLRKIGFKNDIESGVICRYVLGSTTVDIVPVSSQVFGFGNKWYPEGYANAIQYRIDDRSTVKIFTAPYFIATKLEAFKHRGRGDGRTSQDFEDIVFVLENRQAIWDELRLTTGELKNYLHQSFKELLLIKHFPEWLHAHVFQFGSPPADYFILQGLQEFILQSPDSVTDLVNPPGPT
ncbi:MAG TPA: nucleotidyl transferase AbiEii/AbiGii toxin family protein [Bacteroidia bacterium]|nr:nucleotidyl transferase AbiEii/AbiGii toxin family protein [Bacteroidia bacterium]